MQAKERVRILLIGAPAGAPVHGDGASTRRIAASLREVDELAYDFVRRGLDDARLVQACVAGPKDLRCEACLLDAPGDPRRALEVLECLRRVDAYLPVLVLVGDEASAREEEFTEAGATALLDARELDGKRLLRALGAGLGAARGLRELAAQNLRLATLHRLSTTASHPGPRDQHLWRMAVAIAEATRLPLVAIEAWNAARGELDLVALVGSAADAPGGPGTPEAGGAHVAGRTISEPPELGSSYAVAKSREPRLEVDAARRGARPELSFPGGQRVPSRLTLPILSPPSPGSGSAGGTGASAGEAQRGEVHGVLSLGQVDGLPSLDEVLPWAAELGAYLGELLRRRQLEAALETSDERFRQLAENIDQTFWLSSSDRQTLFYISPNCERIWGRTPEEMYARPTAFADHVHPADMARLIQAINAQRRGEQVEVEYRVTNRDGHVRWIRTRAFPVRDEAGQVFRISGISEDITERKHAEESLVLAAKGIAGTGLTFFRRVVENLATTLDLEHVFLLARSASDVPTFDIVAGYSWGDLVEDGQAPIACEATEQAMLGEVVYYPRGVREAFPDNPQFKRFAAESYLGMPLLDSNGSPLGVLCGVQGRPMGEPGTVRRLFQIFAARAAAEVERVRAEKALEHRLEFENLITSISTKFMNLPSDGVDHGIREALRAIGEFAEVERSYVYQFDAEHQTVSNTHEWAAVGTVGSATGPQELPLEQRPWFVQRLREMGVVHVPSLTSLPPEAEALKVTLGEQGIRSMLCVAMASRGETIGYVGFDSTQVEKTWSADSIALLRLVGETFANALERRRSEEERQRLGAQLRQSQKMEAIGTLAGGVAHDFNNLLTGILGYSALILKEVPEGSKLHRAAEVIETAAERAADLTRQLLGFARRGKSQNVAVSLNEIILTVVSLLERTIEKSITIDTDLSEEKAPVLGDPSQLEQVLLNLALNARDAMPTGGVLRFSTRVVHTPRGEGDELMARGLAPRDEQAWLEVLVADTGAGIASAIIERIFDPFFTTKEPGKGTGMGLAMVYGIVDNHGGTIRAESHSGEGACFRMLLPVTDVQAVDHPGGDDKEPRLGSGLVLVVDDEPIVLNVAEQILRHLGYDVLSASNGEHALELYASHGKRIRLVVLDLVMPRMGGREVLRRLKAMDPRVRVILSSGWGLEGEAQELLEEGLLGFARKPYDIPEFSAIIAEAIGVTVPEETSDLLLPRRTEGVHARQDASLPSQLGT